MTFPTSPTAGQAYTTAKGERWEYTGNGWIKPTVNLKMINSDRTFVVGTDFATLNATFAALKGYFIVPNVTLTIQLPSGLTTLTGTIDGYNGSGIVKLLGANMSGAFPGNSDMAVTGTNTGSRNTDSNSNHTLCNARFGSKIYAPGMTAFSLGAVGGIDIMQNLYIYGDGTNGIGMSVAANRTVQLDQVAFSRFNTGVSILSAGRISSAASKFITFGNADIGIKCYYGSMGSPNLISVGNVTDGVRCTNMGFVNGDTGLIAGNGQNGLTCSDAGYAEFPNALFKKSSIGNGQYGIRAYNGGRVLATASSAASQGSTSYNAGHFGYIDATGYVGGATFDPAVNTLGNSNSYIVA